MSAGADRQNEVYLTGLFGEQSRLPVGWWEKRELAYPVTAAQAGCVKSGAGTETSELGRDTPMRP